MCAGSASVVSAWILDIASTVSKASLFPGLANHCAVETCSIQSRASADCSSD